MTEIRPRRSCGSILHKIQEWEHPDRPYVRDIYDALERGFTIDTDMEFGAYRTALISCDLLDDRVLNKILESLADQAHAWLAAKGLSVPG